MTTSAELIQASINKYTGDIVYTFRLIYPRKSWLNLFGNLFEKRLKVDEYVTAVGNGFDVLIGTIKNGVLNGAMDNCDNYAYDILAPLVHERVSFAGLVLNAIRSSRTIGIITSKEVKEAQRLFGDRVQNVLKIYDVGEWHSPFMKNQYFGKHDRLATEQGWSLGPR